MMMKKSVSGAASTMRQQTRSRLNVVASISGKAKTVKGTTSGKKSTATASVNDNKACESCSLLSHRSDFHVEALFVAAQFFILTLSPIAAVLLSLPGVTAPFNDVFDPLVSEGSNLDSRAKAQPLPA